MPSIDELMDALTKNPEYLKKILVDLFNEKTEETPTKKETHIAFVLDSSGSMQLCRQATIEGYNRSVDSTKQDAHLGGDVFITLVTFGEHGDNWETVVKTKYSHKPIDTLEPLSTQSYVPQGGTPMYDGILQAINELKPYDTGGDVAFLVNIFTDGVENYSKTSGPELSKTIRDLQAKGNWTFTVTGANIDLNELAETLGVYAANMQSYVATPHGTNLAHAKYSASSANYMESRGAGLKSVSEFYETQDNTASGGPVFNQQGQVVGNQINIPSFPSPTGKPDKSWEHANDEDDDNSLL
jgi:uncharacterized protein YegL